MMNKTPSLIRIIQTDYMAFLAFLFPIVFWGLYIFLALFQPKSPFDFIYVAIAITIVAFLTLLWRHRTFLSIFSHGIEVPAVVSNASFFRDRGRVDYIYTHEGQKFVSGNAICKTKRTQALTQGDNVILVIDPHNPKRAFIRDLYI